MAGDALEVLLTLETIALKTVEMEYCIVQIQQSETMAIIDQMTDVTPHVALNLVFCVQLI